VRSAERAGADQAAAVKLAGDARDHRGFERFGGSERWEDAGEAGGEERLARAGGADHQHVIDIRPTKA
jgi:hypothetical protein